MIRNILFTDEANFICNGVKIQATPLYGIVIIHMELSKATTNIAFP
jgi:hypothetical protein